MNLIQQHAITRPDELRQTLSTDAMKVALTALYITLTPMLSFNTAPTETQATKKQRHSALDMLTEQL